MPTLFAVYNLKKGSMKEDYDKYLKETKVPGVRGASWCSSFHTWKIDKVLAPAHSEPEGELPDKSPYVYVAKIEVSDLDAMVRFQETDEGKNFKKSYTLYLSTTGLRTASHTSELYTLPLRSKARSRSPN